eukprot:CAMPEP_0185593332 /NCGR_PEP_ID=MMETSP0434-20130131/71131_1 /TAXON_ID=626734 ORGANISM="Favella taraikaensis, Strain Fe Narragansett Bay" /NCGR_SAMPLE_ID=MMETSP0434 /ASSEMBLY_ACC=CAM_ASM_000379 /LENGTH=164 /DNA_ID=CAMNT_0028219833 /DNA_START=75 /DNA_END=569 /DNA_ORIENTATION=-
MIFKLNAFLEKDGVATSNQVTQPDSYIILTEPSIRDDNRDTTKVNNSGEKTLYKNSGAASRYESAAFLPSSYAKTSVPFVRQNIAKLAPARPQRAVKSPNQMIKEKNARILRTPPGYDRFGQSAATSVEDISDEEVEKPFRYESSLDKSIPSYADPNTGILTKE